MEELYLIGNGFDKYHNLLTGFEDFHRYVKLNCTDIKNIFKKYFEFRINDKSLWTNFEEDLGTFKWQSFFNDNNHLNVHDDDFRQSFTYGLEDDLEQQAEQLKADISKAFQDWLETIDLSHTIRKLNFPKNSTFISFNYTLLLEEIYKIEPDRILHIHGDIINDSEELIFGHNEAIEEIPELDENGESNRTIFTDCENAAKIPFYKFYKPVEDIISRNAKTFDLMTTIKKINILGHSLNPIDIAYFKQIHNRSEYAEWHVSYYNIDEREKHLSTLIQMGISPKCIQLFKLQNCKDKIR